MHTKCGSYGCMITGEISGCFYGKMVRFDVMPQRMKKFFTYEILFESDGQ